MRKIAKFGGTSLATAEQILKVKKIITSDPDIRVIVPSAPGKAHADDVKITDLLIMLYKLLERNEPVDAVWEVISNRFKGIIDGLQLDMDLSDELNSTIENIKNGAGFEYTVSRGEALNGRILAELLNAEFVDAVEVIQIMDNGKVDPVSFEILKEKCSDVEKRYIIPGFYGRDGRGGIKTFSRGGSDVTGAVVSNALGADIYENWTDVSGFLLTDPRIVPQAATISEITYQELRELASRGAEVLHADAVSPVKEKGIPINIRNTNKPQDSGTMIVPFRDSSRQKIGGIAGRKGFSTLIIEKAATADEFEFFREVLNLLQELRIPYEQISTSIDTVSVLIREERLEGRKEQLSEALKSLKPEKFTILDGISLIAVVGEGMKYFDGFEAAVFTTLRNQSINIKMIDRGTQDQSIVIGVEEVYLNDAIRAIYSVIAEN